LWLNIEFFDIRFLDLHTQGPTLADDLEDGPTGYLIELAAFQHLRLCLLTARTIEHEYLRNAFRRDATH
jgi:hypothetical protein